MGWIQLAIFIVQMLIKYGPTLWKLGKQIYDEIEARIHGGETLTSDQKAIAFNRTAERAYVAQTSTQPTRKVLNEFRENVWTLKNPGKEPKPLTDVRLRILPKGKTAGAKRRHG
jgi:hypothetical protein